MIDFILFNRLQASTYEAYIYVSLRAEAYKVLRQHQDWRDDIADHFISPDVVPNLDEYIDAAFCNAYQILQEPTEAMDVVASALLSIQGLPYEPSHFLAYLMVTVRNAALRRTKERRRLESFPSIEAPSLTGLIEVETPEKKVIRKEMRERIRKVVDSLPLHYRTIIHLHYYEEMTIAEIAKKLGLPTGTVLSRLSHARALLRPKLLKLVLC